MISVTVSQTAPAQVRLFSPTDSLPPALATLSTDNLWAHIKEARNVMALHKSNSLGGLPGAERWYFTIPEVARDMANARYTLSIMFAEIGKRAQ